MESRYCFNLFIKFEIKSYITSAFSESLYAACTPNRPRGQRNHLLKVEDVIFYEDSLELQFSVVLKHTGPGVHQDNFSHIFKTRHYALFRYCVSI